MQWLYSLFIIVILLFVVSSLTTACTGSDEHIYMQEFIPKVESQFTVGLHETEVIDKCDPEEQQEEPQLETHKISTHVEELHDNEKIVQIRTTIKENFITDTTSFFHTIEFEYIFELGAYEFIITQEINDANRPFIFHFFGECIYVCEDGFYGEASDVLALRITDYDGNLIQRIDGISFFPWMGALHISFEDFNFDGFLDMTIIKHAGGVRGGAPHHIWLWDEEINEFIFNKELSELSHGRNLEVNYETHQVMAWQSSAAGGNYIILEYIEGTPTEVSTLEWIHFDFNEWAIEHLNIEPPEGYTTVLIRRNLTTGEEELWYEVWG